MSKKIDLKNIKSVLIISGPGIGDTFLFTPLASAIKTYNPNIKIDYLVRSGRAQYIKECSEINKVIEFNYKATLKSYFLMVKSIFRKYDLAFATAGTDRFILASFYASKNRVNVIPKLSTNNYWKKFLSTKFIEQEDHIPTSELAVMLAEKACFPKSYKFLYPKSDKINFIEKQNTYAVVHALPQGWWKEWPVQYWKDTIHHLLELGLNVYLTGGPRKEEIKYNNNLENYFKKKQTGNLSVKSLAGKTNFSSLCKILKDASLYVGIDTVTSHIAGSLGVNSVVVFGPVNHVKWAPRPNNYSIQEACWFNSNYGVQTIENVSICKAKCTCRNFKKGCGQDYSKTTRCLEDLGEELIFQAINTQYKLFKDKEEISINNSTLKAS